ncbi:hypothetical protein, conserved [Eimeria tenella]|uniref:Uncharacterized protein n=1 Tax=Eimeria tenella TaxID=5802 RepID=U6L0F8_EIMTE|nr:hypothetical protein, conserved [Eimeria tenella]CDJ41245.1 hypothetical protein, conserved [Eimeria tenella]|eukprot:XP_013231995.1 hypothetical protein, conserved [Eimeria tenella]
MIGPALTQEVALHLESSPQDDSPSFSVVIPVKRGFKKPPTVGCVLPYLAKAAALLACVSLTYLLLSCGIAIRRASWRPSRLLSSDLDEACAGSEGGSDTEEGETTAPPAPVIGTNSGEGTPQSDEPLYMTMRSLQLGDSGPPEQEEDVYVEMASFLPQVAGSARQEEEEDIYVDMGGSAPQGGESSQRSQQANQDDEPIYENMDFFRSRLESSGTRSASRTNTSPPSGVDPSIIETITRATSNWPMFLGTAGEEEQMEHKEIPTVPSSWPPAQKPPKGKRKPPQTNPRRGFVWGADLKRESPYMDFSEVAEVMEKNRHGGASSWREASRAREQQRFRAAGLVKPDEVLVQVQREGGSGSLPSEGALFAEVDLDASRVGFYEIVSAFAFPTSLRRSLM